MQKRDLLLQDSAGECTAGAAGVVVDDAALIGAEHPLAGGAGNLGSTSDSKRDRRNAAIACPHKGVAAFHALGQVVIDQASCDRRGHARSGTTKMGKQCRETASGLGDGLGDRGCVDYAEGGNSGGLVSTNAGPEKTGHGNRGNDQNYGDDNEQLDKRESSRSSHIFSTSRRFRGRHAPREVRLTRVFLGGQTSLRPRNSIPNWR